MKIVVDCAIFHLQVQGGISRVFREVLPRVCVADASVEVTLLYGRGGRSFPLPRHPRITSRFAPRVDSGDAAGWSWRSSAQRLRKLWRRAVVRSDRRSIWHSTYFTLPERWKGAQIVSVHDMIYERFPDLFCSPEDEQFREQKRQSVLAADAILCCSDATRRDVEDFYQLEPGRTQLIPFAASGAFRPLPQPDGAAGTSGSRPFLLYVGARNHYKNFAAVLSAYYDWRYAAECDLVVVGGGEWSPAEREMLRSLRIEERVRLAHSPDDAALCALYNQAAAFVYPSLYEGFGIPLLEAMACGCPIVASRIPSTVEVAGEYPIYFDPRDTESLQEALSLALLQSDRASLLEAGSRINSQYSWERTAVQTLEVYRATLNGAA